MSDVLFYIYLVLYDFLVKINYFDNYLFIFYLNFYFKLGFIFFYCYYRLKFDFRRKNVVNEMCFFLFDCLKICYILGENKNRLIVL